MVNKEYILERLRKNQGKISSFGVKRLALFGSFAADTASETSDLDFLVEFEKNSFDAYMGLKHFLEDLFQRPVDLVLPDTIKPRLKPQILSEAIDAA